MTKEEIAQNKQFLLLPQCFPLLVIGYPFKYREFLLFVNICSKLSAAELSYEEKVKEEKTYFRQNISIITQFYPVLWVFVLFHWVFTSLSTLFQLYHGDSSLIHDLIPG